MKKKHPIGWAPRTKRALQNQRAEMLVDGMLKTDLLESTSAYLSRGRQMAGISIGELQAHWAEAFRNMIRQRSEESFRAVNDACAELSLRGIEPDSAAVAPELAQVVEEIRRDQEAHPDGTPEIRNAIREYMRRADEEMN